MTSTASAAPAAAKRCFIGPPLGSAPQCSPALLRRRGDELRGIRAELPPAALLADRDVLDPQAEAARDDDRRLVGERHAGLERCLVLLRDERALVDVQADAVAHAVAEMLAHASLLD